MADDRRKNPNPFDEMAATNVEEEKPFIPPVPTPAPEPETIPIDLGEEVEAAKSVNLKTFGGSGGKLGVGHKDQYRRKVNITGAGATRCRMFHARLAAAPLEYMEKQINEWIDNEDIEVKHVGHVVGTLEGKTAEPNVIVIVWY